jgi:signal transduction histidine kinase
MNKQKYKNLISLEFTLKLTLLAFLFQFFFLPKAEAQAIKYIGKKQGLQERSATSVEQDDMGYIWISTIEGGFYRYDGEQLISFKDRLSSRDNNKYNCIYKTSSGLFWICGDGITVFSPFDMSSYTYYSGKQLYGESSTKSNTFYSLAKDKKTGKVWGSCEQGIIYFENEHIDAAHWIDFKPYDNPCYQIVSDKKGILYFFTFRSIYELRESINLEIIYQSPLKKEWRHVINPLLDLEGNFIGFYNEGTEKYHDINKLNEEKKNPPDDALTWESIRRQFGKFNSEVLPLIDYDLNRGKFKVFKSKDQTTWILSTVGLFLLAKSRRNFEVINSLSGISIRGFYEDSQKNRLYISTYKGLVAYDCRSRVCTKIFNDLAYKVLYKKGDKLLVMTENIGLQWWNVKTKQVLKIMPVDNGKFSTSTGTFISKTNILTFAIGGILYDYDIINEKITLNKINLNSLVDTARGNIMAIYRNSLGQTWISSDKGVYCFDKDNHLKEYAFSRHTLLSKESFVVDFFEDYRGNLWLASKKSGLIELNLAAETIKSYTTKNGLASNELYAILSKDFGKNLWISSANGLSHFNTLSSQFSNYHSSDGLAHNEFNRASALASSKGIFYFGGINGVSLFNPDKIENDSIRIRPILLNYGIYNIKDGLHIFEKFGSPPKEIILRPTDNIIEFQLTCNDYSYIIKREYAYYLQGFDQDWIYTGINNNKIRYTNLLAGKYKLKIKTINQAGQWSEEELEINITVEQIFYKRWYFIAACILLLFISFYSILHYHWQQLKKFNEIRLAIGTNIHDELGGTLFAINHIANEIKKNKTVDDQRLVTLAELCQNAYKSIGELIWTVNPDNQYMYKLLTKMEDELQTILSSDAKNVKLSVININKKSIIKMDIAYHFLMIFKESLVNIRKHSIAEAIDIKLENKDKFVLEIKSTYESLKEHNVSTRNGIRNMEYRAKQIKGKLRVVHNEKAKQFTIILELKKISNKYV